VEFRDTYIEGGKGMEASWDGELDKLVCWSSGRTVAPKLVRLLQRVISRVWSLWPQMVGEASRVVIGTQRDTRRVSSLGAFDKLCADRMLRFDNLSSTRLGKGGSVNEFNSTSTSCNLSNKG